MFAFLFSSSVYGYKSKFMSSIVGFPCNHGVPEWTSKNSISSKKKNALPNE